MLTLSLRKNLIVMMVVLAAAATIFGCEAAEEPQPTATRMPTPSPDQPYTGLEQREIRALSPEKVEDLLAGRGSGYALAAELNHYPGPTHVLEMRDLLDLSADQADAVSAIKAAMSSEAVRLGTQLVDLEQELDAAFRSATISPDGLSTLLTQISTVDGQPRNTHLQAHLQMVEILSSDQVAQYDELRGYGSDNSQPSHDQHNMDSMDHG